MGRIGIQLGLISLTPWIRFPPPQLFKFLNMEEKRRMLECVTSKTLRGIVEFINEKQLNKEDLFYLDKDRGEYSLLYFK